MPACGVSLAQADGSFAAPELVVANFGYDAGGWRVERHPRFLADMTGDGRADIVGFGNAGVYVSRAQADGTFTAPQLVVDNFAYNAGGWRVEQPSAVPGRHDRRRPRRHRRVRQRRCVRVARAGRRHLHSAAAGGRQLRLRRRGWRVEQHPRFLADTTGDGRADIVGFGNAGVYVSRALADGTFEAPGLVITDFGYNAGGWRVESTRASSPTPPAMGAPTSSGSATPESSYRGTDPPHAGSRVPGRTGGAARASAPRARIGRGGKLRP